MLQNYVHLLACIWSGTLVDTRAVKHHFHIELYTTYLPAIQKLEMRVDAPLNDADNLQ